MCIRNGLMFLGCLPRDFWVPERNWSFVWGCLLLCIRLLTLCLFVMLGIVVHQESVCATFGSGLSSTCVVDVGDQKTSVCCVEDGVSHRNTRYGSSPITVYLNHHRSEIVWDDVCVGIQQAWAISTSQMKLMPVPLPLGSFQPTFIIVPRSHSRCCAG